MRLEIEGVSKRYGNDEALRPTTLAAGEGELLAVLGPSGCGKTTLLGIVAGLVHPSAGDVRLEGRSLAGLPPEARGIPMVFQDHLLFPNMTVRGNVAFGLTLRRLPGAERDARVAEALAAVRLEGLGDRYPAQLSGGQKQRVALARAMVLRPLVLLMDEPFSNLDTSLRQEMRELVSEARRSYGFTSLLVTHDPEEALAMADRVVVMQNGAVQQIDAPATLYARPRTRFVAGFVGPANFVPARDGRGTLCVRPEQLRFSEDAPSDQRIHAVSAVVARRYFAGARVDVRLETPVGELRWHGSPNDPAARIAAEPGRRIFVGWDEAEAARVE